MRLSPSYGGTLQPVPHASHSAVGPSVTRGGEEPAWATQLWSQPSQPQVGQATQLQFVLRHPVTGVPPLALHIVHEKPAHLFLIREDLSDFQHLHPTPSRHSPGQMTVDTAFPTAGRWRAYLQVTTPDLGTTTQTLGFAVAGPASQTATPPPLVPDAHVPKRDGDAEFLLQSAPLQAGQPAMLMVDITQTGRPAPDIRPYLGAAAHAVLVHANTGAFLHVHPMNTIGPDGRVTRPLHLHTRLPQPGLYKLWVQTQVGPQLRTVSWVLRAQ